MLAPLLLTWLASANPPLDAGTPEEVQTAIKRIFKNAVVIDASRKPSFLFGDFNGDFSQDLAVIIKPAEGKLSELNQEFLHMNCG